MDKQDFVRVDGIKWWVAKNSYGRRIATPVCPQHDMKMKPVEVSYRDSRGYSKKSTERSRQLECADGPHTFDISRRYSAQKEFVLDKIDSRVFKQASFITLDDEVIPVAREKLKDSPYWVDAKVTKSKSGTRLVIWAGDRNHKNKTQLFVESDLKRLSFDQNDTHPNEVFAIVEASFKDGSKASIKSED